MTLLQEKLPLDSFFEAAKQVQLTPEERVQIRQAISDAIRDKKLSTSASIKAMQLIDPPEDAN